MICGYFTVMLTEPPGDPENPNRPKKINLRRPDIMEQVQAQVLSHYRSEIVEKIRGGGGVLSAGNLTVKLAKEFGFCYGVERAIDLAYAAKKYFAEVAPKPRFICSAKSSTTPRSTTRSATWASRSFPQNRPKPNWQNCMPAMSSSFPLSARKSPRANGSRKKAANWWTPLAAT